MENIKFHPLADIFPLIRGKEFADLKVDIRANGVREPIVMLDGMILDGRNRFRAAQESGITPEFVEYDGDDPLAYVISLNLHRRHLDEGQRGIVATKIATLTQKDNQHAQICASTPTQTEAADMLNVSRRTVQHARKVVDEGVPELVDKVMSGDVSVSAAADVATIEDKAEQAEIVAKGEQEIVKEANRIRREKKKARQEERQKRKQEIPADLPRVSERYSLINSSIDKLKDCVAPESVDWIITDPPYPREFLYTYSQLSEFADHALKPGGSVIAMAGQSYLPEVICRLSESLEYYWTLAYMTPGGQSPSIWTRKVNTFWKPLLWFVKGDYRGDKVGDVRKSPPNDNDKVLHHWGQSEGGMLDIIETFTYPGQMIVDPFCGSGTTGIAAVRANRLFLGADISEDEIKSSALRLKEFVESAAA